MPCNLATSFSIRILMSAALGDDLIKNIGIMMIGTECRAFGNNFLGIPPWDRETVDETEPQQFVIATGKHYAGLDPESWGGVTWQGSDTKTTVRASKMLYAAHPAMCLRFQSWMHHVFVQHYQ